MCSLPCRDPPDECGDRKGSQRRTGLASSGVDLPKRLAVSGPVIEVAPRFGVMLGEGIFEVGGAGLGGGGEGVSGLQPLLVQLVEPVEGVAQDAQLVDPAALHRVLRQLNQLRLGGGQQVTGAVAERLERREGVGVALARAPAVGVVVVGPAVEVGVLFGVGVPGVEDLLAVAQIVVEVTEEVVVCVVVGGDEVESCRFSGERPAGLGRRSPGPSRVSSAAGGRSVPAHEGT